jgi:hypothetical protein
LLFCLPKNGGIFLSPSCMREESSSGFSNSPVSVAHSPMIRPPLVLLTSPYAQQTSLTFCYPFPTRRANMYWQLDSLARGNMHCAALVFSNRRLIFTGEIDVHELTGQSLNAIPATNYLLQFRIYGTQRYVMCYMLPEEKRSTCL